jgi:hypothetical protein
MSLFRLSIIVILAPYVDPEAMSGACEELVRAILNLSERNVPKETRETISVVSFGLSQMSWLDENFL